MWMSLAWAMILSSQPNARAQGSAERYLFKDGQVWAVQASKAAPLEDDIELPNHITVSTNGTFKVGTHSPRAFAEGQILGADGMLISPSGKIEPVLDHVAITAGRTVSSVNGEISTVDQEIQLGPDRRLTSDRVLLGRDGSWMRVIDGQLFTPDGKTISTVDTISLQQGKVVVQKDGAQFAIDSGRSIMMNEGTKAFGDGRVVGNDGQITELTEGQIILIQGVVKLR
jgi:hypothetical protein